MKMLVFLLAALGVCGVSGSENLLPKGDFEGSDWPSPSWMRNLLTAEYEQIGTVEAPDRVLVFRADTGRQGTVWQLPMLPGEGERKIRFSARVMLENCDPAWRVTIRFQAGDKHWTLATPEDKGELPWTTLAQELTLPEGVKNGQIMISFAGPASGGRQGVARIDDVELRLLDGKPEKPEIRSLGVHARGNLFYPGEAVRFPLRIRSTNAGVLHWTLTDWSGRERAKGELPLTPQKEYGEIRRLLALPEPDLLGFFAVRLEWREKGIKRSETTISGCRVEPVTKRDPFFSLSLFHLNAGRVPWLDRLGCGSGLVFYPRKQEVSPGVCDFTEQEAMIRAFAQAGLVPVGAVPVFTVYHNPPWLLERAKNARAAGKAPFDDAYYQEYRKFVAAMIGHAAGRIRDWSVVNEIDLSIHNDPDQEEHYIRCVKILAEELRRLAPGATVGGIGVTGHDFRNDFKTLRHFWKELGGILDGVYFDAYNARSEFGPGFREPCEEKSEFRKLLQTAAAIAGPDKRVVIEEKGYKITRTLPVNSPYAIQLGAMVARSYIIAKSVPQLRRYSYFMIDNEMNEGGLDYGLWRDGNPRPAAGAYATVARMLAGTEPVAEVIPVDECFGYLFRDGAETVLTLWTIADNPVEAQLEMPGRWETFDMMGNRVAGGAAGRAGFQLTGNVLYCRIDAAPETCIETVRRGIFRTPPVAAALLPDGANRVRVAVKNRTQQELRTRISVNGQPEQPLVLAPRATGSIQVAVPREAWDKAFDVTVTSDGVSSRFRLAASLLPVKRLTIPPAMDGTLRGLESVVPISMRDASFLFPKDAEPNGLWRGPADCSADLYLAYDAHALYFTAAVIDDVPISRENGARLWSQDAIQFAIDTANRALPPPLDAPGYRPGDGEFTMALTPSGPELYCHRAVSGDRKGFPKLAPVIRITPDGSKIYQLAIPWSVLGVLRPTTGAVFGFNAVIFDVDRPNDPVSYWLQLTPGITGGKAPGLFRRFILQ